MSHIHELVTFPESSGTLSGNLQIPEGTLKGAVLLSHCFTCSKSLKITRRLATGIAGLDRPLLVVHGPPDTIVPISEGHKIFDTAAHPKWFAAIPDADHLFSKPATADKAAAAIVAFLDVFLS